MNKLKAEITKNISSKYTNEIDNFRSDIISELGAAVDKFKWCHEFEQQSKKQLPIYTLIKYLSLIIASISVTALVIFSILNIAVGAGVTLLTSVASSLLFSTIHTRIVKIQTQLQHNRISVIEDALNTHCSKDYWYIQELRENPETDYRILLHRANYEYNWFKNDIEDNKKILAIYNKLHQELNKNTELYVNYVEQVSNNPYPREHKLTTVKELKGLLKDTNYVRENRREIEKKRYEEEVEHQRN